MQMERFRNMLRTLRSIDAHELPAEAFPHPDDRAAFVRDPFGALIRADQSRADAIYNVMLSRQRWTDSEAPAAELRDLLEGMVDGDAPGHDSTVSHALRLLDEVEAGR